MQSLIFDSVDVRRVVDHSIAAPAQMARTIRDKTGQLVEEAVTAPAVLLVRDHGLYLMSNGLPRDIVSDERSFVGYAKGCDPFLNTDWRARSAELVGEDDISIFLPWTHDFMALIDAGASTITLTIHDGVVEMPIG